MPAFLTQILGRLRASRSAAAHSPGDNAASAARGPRSLPAVCGLSSRNFPSARIWSRGYPEAGGRLPPSVQWERRQWSRPPAGVRRDFRVMLPSLPADEMDQSGASPEAASRFKLRKGNFSLAAAWPNG